MKRLLGPKLASSDILLAPLTAEYVESEHGLYVDELNAAIANDEIRNVALSGNYGVGKSSILKRVVEMHRKRVVELSLSALAPIETEDLDDSIPKQAATPTNQIQQEIVKQLLYREPPGNTPASRFRRIQKFRPFRELAIAALSSIVVSLAFVIAGWTAKILVAFPGIAFLESVLNVEIFGVSILVLFVLRSLTYGRLSIKQVTAGTATVILDDRSVSYFDQYLDEIVYFFEVSRTNIVIFEDIDRFNDANIFEALRSLNTLLNASPQVARPITFVYAIKDSIFDRIGADRQSKAFDGHAPITGWAIHSEAIRANRTKFFDLVIPVVPFITHQSARNLTTQLLRNVRHSIDPELIDLASRFVPDMRLLKNVRNEFLVFRDRIFSGDGERLMLKESELFAMMLYKSTHLADFELIRLGSSRIDALYKSTRSLVAENIRKIEHDSLVIQRRQETYNSLTVRSDELGEQLIAYGKRASRSCNFDESNANYVFSGRTLSREELRKPTFWSEFLQASDATSIELVRPNNYYSHGQIDRLTFLRSDLSDVFGPFSPADWEELDTERMASEQRANDERVKFLKSADMKELTGRSEFLLRHEGAEKTLDAITREMMTSELGYQLIRSGYINRNFTLYTSIFHGDRVSSAATNFIIHHVERNTMDEYFQLDEDDVDAVIRECGEAALGSQALYNISILDHVLSQPRHSVGAQALLTSLTQFGEEQMQFLRAYLTSGSRRTEFVRRLTDISPQTLSQLASMAELDETERLSLLDSALTSLSPSLRYSVNDELAKILTSRQSELQSVTDGSLSETSATLLSDVFAIAHVKIGDLARLSPVVRRAFVDRNLYEITFENLASTGAAAPSAALDTLSAANEPVYQYMLSKLGHYADAIEGKSNSVDSAQEFGMVLNAISPADYRAIDHIVRLASKECMVDDITSVPTEVWESLANNERFRCTATNIYNYAAWAGMVDAQLAKILRSQGQIVEHATITEEQKLALSKMIFSAADRLSQSLRAELVRDLELEKYIHADEIQPEAGEYFARLIEYRVINDDASSYARLDGMDWGTHEAYIQVSKKFKAYMSPQLVGEDLYALMSSNDIDDEIKDEVIIHSLEYAAVGGDAGLLAMARYASVKSLVMPIELIKRLPAIGAPLEQTLTLLRAHLDTASISELTAVLSEVGGAYAEVTTVGKDRPKVAATDDVRALLDALKRHGIVSSYVSEGDKIRVSKKH